jgi:hypothetical protein
LILLGLSSGINLKAELVKEMDNLATQSKARETLKRVKGMAKPVSKRGVKS